MLHYNSHRGGPVLALLAAVLLIVGVAAAQGEDVVVPDVSGLTVPQAAAELNRAGLRLGQQNAQQWTAASPYDPGVVGGQSLAPGQPVPAGSAVDVSLFTTANVRVVYDDNDLTLINDTGSALNLTTLLFNGTDGTRRFLASRWRGSLDSGDCTQVWSVSRFNAKDVDGCSSTFWLTTNDPAEYFWTQAAGAGPFQIVQNGVAAATCDPAPPNSQDAPLTCEFFTATSADTSPTTPYVYFVYTEDRFTAVNTSADAWMPLDATRLQIPGLELNLGNFVLFGSPDIVGDLRRLAPGQCSMLTLASVGAADPLEDCDLIAQAPVEPSNAFWTVPFEVVPSSGAGDGEQLTCPAATPGRPTICVMPR